MSSLDEDIPMELLWKDLRLSPLWMTIERKLLDKRDKMVAKIIVEEDCKPKRGQDGSIESEDAGVILARLQRKMGYVEAINAILDEPRKAEQAARTANEAKAKETK